MDKKRFLNFKRNNEKVLSIQQHYKYFVAPKASKFSRYDFERSNTVVCPFHDDNDPSFGVIKGKDGVDRYHCFGCGEHGDVIDFVRKYEQIGFKEAFEKLGGDTKPLGFKESLELYDRKKQEQKERREKEKRREERNRIKDEAEYYFYKYLETKTGTVENAEILAKLWTLYYRFMSFLETQTINYDISEDFDLWLAWIS